jgi:polar amino acid transport system permease protein
MISAPTLALMREWMPELIEAAGHTIKMAVFAYLLGAISGLLLALGGMSRRRWIGLSCRAYIEFVRGTPTLTQLFLVYFGLTSFGIALPSFEAAVITLGLHYAAYMAEIYRSGISSVHRGQQEAAQAIGMTRREAMRYIILPQSLKVILPPMTNSAISLIKDTSVASLISAPEIMLRANDLASQYYMPMELYLITGVMYFLMAYPLSLAVRYLERSTDRSRRLSATEAIA